jgi:hypothetical protein
MFHLLWEAIIGLIVGALAKLIMPGKDPGGIIVTMLIGISRIHCRRQRPSRAAFSRRFFKCRCAYHILF